MVNDINFKLLLLIVLLIFSLVGTVVYNHNKIMYYKLEQEKYIEQMKVMNQTLQQVELDYNITNGKKKALEEKYLEKKDG